MKSWLAPLTGAIFIALLVAGFALVGETPDATEDSAQEVLDFYAEDDDKIAVGSLLSGSSAVFLLFFAGWVRALLRNSEGPAGILSAVAFGGAVVLAVGLASSAAFTFATADIAEGVEDPIVFQTLNTIVWGYWLPFAVGVFTFMVATGISIVRHGALPKWLGWVAIVAGAIMFSPAFIVAGPVVGLWILFVSITSAVKRRGDPTATPA